MLGSVIDTEQVCDVILLFKEFSTKVEYQMDIQEKSIDLQGEITILSFDRDKQSLTPCPTLRGPCVLGTFPPNFKVPLNKPISQQCC